MHSRRGFAKKQVFFAAHFVAVSQFSADEAGHTEPAQTDPQAENEPAGDKKHVYIADEVDQVENQKAQETPQRQRQQHRAFAQAEQSH